MDRQTRKDLKTDKFAEEVVDIFEWTSLHKAKVVRYGAVLIALVLIVVGVMYYNRSQAAARQEAKERGPKSREISFSGAPEEGNLTRCCVPSE